MSNTIPPFAPALPSEVELARLLLSQGERQRTGHMYKDCPALDVVAPGRAKACKPCLDRWQANGALARAHQKAYDAAWYAEQARQDLGTPTSIGLVETDDGFSIPKIDAHEAWVPATHREAITNTPKPNRYGGRCVNCNAWVEAGAGALAKDRNGKWAAQHLGACPEIKPAPERKPEAELPAVAEGYYALETKDEARQPVAFYRIEHGAKGGRWEGFVFLSRLIGGQGYVPVKGPQKASLLARIAEDPEGASRLYGRTSGRCGRCNTELSDASSIAEGIGPVCATKAWF